MKPQHERPGLGRARLGWLLAGLALLAPLASPAHATRIGPWLNSTLTTQYFLPTMPNTNDAATFVIAGRFPWPCGAVVDTRVLDPDHVTMTFRFSTGCVDSARNWRAEFPLGYLPEGHRDLLVLVTVERPDSAAVLDSSYFSYDVVGNGSPPPPPPPPPPGSELILGWQSEPVHPHPGDDVRIHIWGNAPFDCPTVVNESIGGDMILQATLAPHPGCGDTTNFYTHDFDLGTLPNGNYSSLILVHVAGDTLTARENYAISVNDSIPAPPGPPSGIGPWLRAALTTQYFEPTLPNVNEPATFGLAGRFPWPCGSVVDARVLDQGHVAMTFRFSTGCVDSARNWRAEFPLGYLPEGHHDLQVLLTVERPDSVAVLDSSYFSYDVTGNGSPPPPPPPPPGAELILGWQTLPVHPHPGDDVRIHVWGDAPFDCPAVENESIGGDLILQATLAPHPGCSDTSRFYTHDFDLGTLAKGSYGSLILIHVAGDTLTARESYAFSVNDSIPGPPPPPDDSLKATLSATKPNPFAVETQFSVSVQNPVAADVAIYDLLGRRVATVFRGTLPAGTSQLVWNGRRQDGSRAPGGLYFYRLVMPGRVVSRRVVRLSPGN